MGTGYTFDEDEFREVLRGWQDRREHLERVRGRFVDLAAIRSQRPADDPATLMFVERARQALDAANQADQAMRVYVDRFIAKLAETAATYQSMESDNAKRMGDITL